MNHSFSLWFFLLGAMARIHKQGLMFYDRGIQSQKRFIHIRLNKNLSSLYTRNQRWTHRYLTRGPLKSIPVKSRKTETNRLGHRLVLLIRQGEESFVWTASSTSSRSSESTSWCYVMITRSIPHGTGVIFLVFHLIVTEETREGTQYESTTPHRSGKPVGIGTFFHTHTCLTLHSPSSSGL